MTPEELNSFVNEHPEADIWVESGDEFVAQDPEIGDEVHVVLPVKRDRVLEMVHRKLVDFVLDEFSAEWADFRVDFIYDRHVTIDDSETRPLAEKIAASLGETFEFYGGTFTWTEEHAAVFWRSSNQ